MFAVSVLGSADSFITVILNNISVTISNLGYLLINGQGSTELDKMYKTAAVFFTTYISSQWNYLPLYKVQ
jgi:hypothetical protein